ncbi:hypothetical protein DAPPUDRAFT_114770 [Daphnia pulex]|uniref:Uncharacterized protein n=1 Tax=Daphnia pulex TaxID=6669 RepID=E9HJ72_DAPPU|nr:hypothetical protein DAPPUDRAFT_114770 [Daphnia pulex]|eukprot:EFX68193.1 hypothetical protein DAPPUDRAFT_114770 [Daphnia pulex]
MASLQLKTAIASVRSDAENSSMAFKDPSLANTVTASGHTNERHPPDSQKSLETDRTTNGNEANDRERGKQRDGVVGGSPPSRTLTSALRSARRMKQDQPSPSPAASAVHGRAEGQVRKGEGTAGSAGTGKARTGCV